MMRVSYMLSDELLRFLNEINCENNKSDIIITCDDITFVIFTVCKNGIFMNSGLKVLPKGLRYSILSKITARMLTLRDRTADVTYCADVTLFSARDVRRTITECVIFSAQIPCVSFH